MREIQVRFEPEHVSTVTFDDAGTPFLQFGRHPEYGNGWTLYYLDENAGVDDRFIPGDVANVDDVVASAASWLELTEQPDQGAHGDHE